MRKTLPALLLGTLGLLAALPSAAARFGMPDPVTERGRLIESIYAKIAIAGIAVFVVVFVLLVYVLWRYRAASGKGRATHEKHRGSLKAEAAWTLIPLAVVMWVGVISYQGLLELDAPHEEAQMEIGISGSQWTWIADYGQGVTISSSPDKGAVADDRVFLVPEDTDILFNVTGTDVIHAFAIQDIGGGPVGMIDANPSGPHKYSGLMVNFPAGEYLVQCKEMCLNPGHAYMRARIQAVPQADFDFWLAKQELGVGAKLKQEMTVSASGFGALADQTVVAGTRLIVAFENDGGAPVTLSAPGEASTTVAPGATGLFALDVPDEGAYTLTASGLGEVTFTGLAAETVTVNLGNFELIPDQVRLDVGKTYLFQLGNVDNKVHNLYVGSFGGTVLASSDDASPGAEVSFVWTPEAAGTYDMWCNVPGHHGSGMFGTITVA